MEKTLNNELSLRTKIEYFVPKNQLRRRLNLITEQQYFTLEHFRTLVLDSHLINSINIIGYEGNCTPEEIISFSGVPRSSFGTSWCKITTVIHCSGRSLLCWEECPDTVREIPPYG